MFRLFGRGKDKEQFGKLLRIEGSGTSSDVEEDEQESVAVVQSSVGQCAQSPSPTNYYMVGNPVCIRKTAFETFNKPDIFEIYLREDDDIKPEELLLSFPLRGTVKLFLTEDDARHYVLVQTRGGNFYEDATYAQPAIFTVQCPIGKDQKVTAGTYTPYCHQDGIKHEIKKTLNFYEVDVKSVSPISVQLQVYILALDKKQEFPKHDLPEAHVQIFNLAHRRHN